jgi:acetyl esterase/lipase
MKWLLPVLSVAFCAMSLLSIMRAPITRPAWLLAVIITEYGHWLLVLPLGLVLVAYGIIEGAWRDTVFVLGAVTAVGLLRPAFTAWGMAGGLKQNLDRSFGPAPAAIPTWSWSRLVFGWRTRPGAVRTAVYSRPGGVELELDFYPAAPGATGGRPAPCVIVIHGGGWDSGDRRQLAEYNHRLAARGWAVAAIDYRLAPRWIWPAQKEDVFAALRWLRSEAATLGIDPARLVLLGRSAGGQVAIASGYAARDPGVCGVISFYGMADMRFAYSVAREGDFLKSRQLLRGFLGGTPGEVPDNYGDASAHRLLNGNTPPTLLLHGALDTLVWRRHSDCLEADLRAAAVPHCHLALPWATHAFDLNPDGPGGQLADHAIMHFLGRVIALPAGGGETTFGAGK